jgi:hypothetical protein
MEMKVSHFQWPTTKILGCVRGDSHTFVNGHYFPTGLIKNGYHNTDYSHGRSSYNTTRESNAHTTPM